MVVFAVMSATHKTGIATEEIKLAKGEISIFQYCSHIGKAAVDDNNCREFNLIYGPQ